MLVRSDSTVPLHEVLQIPFGWDDSRLNRFQLRGREYAVYRDGGGIMVVDARSVRLDRLKLSRLERFVYEYDFGDSWIHDLRLETALSVTDGGLNRWNRASRSSLVNYSGPLSSADGIRNLYLRNLDSYRRTSAR
jgi:hypothetical protein